MINYTVQDNMLKDLQNLVKIESISGQPEGKYPFGRGPHDALEYILELCSAFGFITKKCGNYTGYAEIGQGEKLMGILVHLDIVPPGQGWNTDPYEGVILDEKIYGRGVADDKGPAIAVVYAMKDIVDSGNVLDKRVRIVFGCSEETGNWSDMEFYKATEELPDFGFTPDADFPLIYAEKGIVILNLKMEKSKSGLIKIQGGEAHNVVPDTCIVTYLNSKGNELSIIKKGKSAHGSTPNLGQNAIGLAMKETNGKFAEFYRSTIAETVDGSLLNCHFVDQHSGEITINPGLISSDDDYVTLTLDIRYPISFTEIQVVDRIKNTVSPYGVSVEVIGGEKPVFIDKDSEFIKNLMSAYRDVTGDTDSQPMTMGGGSYAKAMNNIVAFGAVFPGRECTEHQANEYVYIEDLYKARKIYRLAIERA